MNQITLVPADVKTLPNGAGQSHIARLLTQWLRQLPFILVVVVPTILAAIYYGLIAADRFEAETKFVIRSPSNAATSQLASLVQGSSIIRSADDAYIVHAYLASRDIVQKLVSTADLRARLDRPEADILWRYPSPFSSHNEERLFKHMKRIVTVDYDYSTGITTLKVQAFRPQDARELAEAMLIEFEALINRLSERAQADAISAAQREVELTRAAARETQAKITSFRHRIGMIDPGRVSATALDTIARLALEVAQTTAQMAEIQRASPQSNQIASLGNRKTALEEQILSEQKRLAGTGGSLAPLIAEYERLVLEREFAERTFASALTSLEAARLDTERQRLFLERISAPTAPDYAHKPSRVLNVLGIMFLAWAIYGIGRMLLEDTLTHGDM